MPPTPSPMADDRREELEALRFESQTLRARLEDYRDPAVALRKALGTCWHRAKGRLRALSWKAAGRAPTTAAMDLTPVEAYRVRVPSPVGSPRPRIVHAIGNLHAGGSSQLVVDLIERLGDRYDQQVVARDLPPSPAYVGVPLEHRPEFSGVDEASRLLAELDPALLHVHYLGHHADHYGEADWRWYHRLFQAAEHRNCPVIENVNIPVVPYRSAAVARYVFVSDVVRTTFGYRECSNVTIHPGSDLGAFSRPADAPIPDDCIGMVYRLEGDKLDERSIDVFIEVVRRRPGTRALIVGGGRFLEPYRARVAAGAAEGGIRFTGAVAYRDLPALYRQMSVFVAPVHTESFGQVSAFAMGMGIPVAGYQVGALPEIVGDEALLAAPGDSRRLAEIVIGLLDDRERRLAIGKRNRSRAEALFSVQAMVGAYDRLYREVLAERGVPCPG